MNTFKVLKHGDILVYGPDGWRLKKSEEDRSCYPWEGYEGIAVQIEPSQNNLVFFLDHELSL